jgi:mycothiol synthase
MLTNRSIPLPELPGYIFRFAQRADLLAIRQMLIEVAAADRTGYVETPEDMDNQFNDPWCDPQRDFLLAVTSDGQIAAMGRIFVNPAPRRERYASLWNETQPDHRGLGLETLILTWMEARASQRLLEYPADLPRTLRTTCLDYLPERIRLLELHGFHAIRTWCRMRRDVRESIPEEHIPGFLTLGTYRPELDRPLMEAFNECFADHWGFEPTSEEDWQMFYIQAKSFRPDLTFLAMDGEGKAAQIAGFCINFVGEEDNQREGIAEGRIAVLGTRRPWRKRGVASALLCESMRAFKAAGLEYAGLGVDIESQTGALNLYKRLGFTISKRWFTFSKPFK